jgi:hypothetical protein
MDFRTSNGHRGNYNTGKRKALNGYKVPVKKEDAHTRPTVVNYAERKKN